MVTAIGNLWPLFLILLVSVILYNWRNEWPAHLKNLIFRAKLGSLEAEIRREFQKETSVAVTPDLVLPATVGEAESLQKLPSAEVDAARPPADLPNLSLRSTELIAFWDKNEAAAVEAYERLQKAESDPTKKLENEARHFYLRYRHLGDAKALSQLESLKHNPGVISVVNFWLGIAHEESDPEKAGEYFEKAVETATSDIQLQHAIAAGARCLDPERGISRVAHELTRTKNPETLKSCFLSLATLFERLGRHNLRAIACEKALEYSPNDTDLLFSAAYSYSLSGLLKLSVHHYKSILSFESNNAVTWNNLGAAYDHLNLPLNSVAAYQRSVSLKHTLAMANLAHLFIKAGFEDHAIALLREANAEENVDPNVGRASVKLADDKEKEKRINEQIIETARITQRFFRLFGDGYFIESDSASLSFSGKWKSERDIELVIERKEDALTGTWTAKTKGLPVLLSHGATETVYSFSGTARNRGATIEIHQKKEYSETISGSIGLQSTFLTAASTLVEEGYAYLTNDGKELHTLTFKDSRHTIEKFMRII